jgi:hypothetical protein
MAGLILIKPKRARLLSNRNVTGPFRIGLCGSNGGETPEVMWLERMILHKEKSRPKSGSIWFRRYSTGLSRPHGWRPTLLLDPADWVPVETRISR